MIRLCKKYANPLGLDQHVLTAEEFLNPFFSLKINFNFFVCAARAMIALSTPDLNRALMKITDMAVLRYSARHLHARAALPFGLSGTMLAKILIISSMYSSAIVFLKG